MLISFGKFFKRTKLMIPSLLISWNGKILNDVTKKIIWAFFTVFSSVLTSCFQKILSSVVDVLFNL